MGGPHLQKRRQQPANYWPVFLTLITCKVLEHIIHSNMTKHFDLHHILNDAQHGSRKMYSHETQCLVTMYDIAKNLNLGDQVDVMLLNFSKDFNKVSHQCLLHKLQYYGVGNKTLSWIQSFLTGKIQQMPLEDTLSSSAAVLSGALGNPPQKMPPTKIIWPQTGNLWNDHAQTEINVCQIWSNLLKTCRSYKLLEWPKMPPTKTVWPQTGNLWNDQAQTEINVCQIWSNLLKTCRSYKLLECLWVAFFGVTLYLKVLS